MRHIVTAMIIALVLPAATPAAELRVVSTLPDFAALAAELGGERVQAESLIRGTQDPHYVDAKPSFIVKVNRADLLIVIGLGLEAGWLPVLLTQARNGAVQPGGRGYLDASQVVTVREVPINPDRSMGDVHGGGNPHYYTSPAELYRVARAIHQRLLELDPDGAAVYQRRWQAFDEKYAARTTAWKRALAPLAGERVVVYHLSWIYLLRWAGLERAGALEPKPGIPPSAGQVTRLLARVRQRGVRYVLQEIYHPSRLSRVFAAKAGAELKILPSMVGAAPGIDTVWDKFDRIVELLSAG
jgi:zinc/manganese transport system substrate-binding protein